MYNRGEANNTTDFIETALLLAAAGWDEYYQDAERMIRNGLLRYQILDTSWIAVPTQPPPDTDIRTYRDIAERIRGGFCFATPNGFNSYNTDLTGGSLQGLCETWHNAITEKGGQVRVNLFFSQSHEGIDLISHIPREGQLLISTSRDIDLAVRVPKWAETTEATLAGKPLPCSIEGNYLRVGPVLAGSKVEVRFGRGEEFQLTEVVGADSYTTRWICDTVVAICPPGKIMPLYLGNVG